MLNCSAQREFIFGFQFNDIVSGISPVGYVYIINPSSTATASVTITTPLITAGPDKVNISLSVNPGTSAYVTIPSDALMGEVSGIQSKGKTCTRGVGPVEICGLFRHTKLCPIYQWISYTHVGCFYLYNKGTTTKGSSRSSVTTCPDSLELLPVGVPLSGRSGFGQEYVRVSWTCCRTFYSRRSTG